MDTFHESLERAVPRQNWRGIVLSVLFTAALATTAWEWRARAEGYPTDYYADSEGLWAIARRAASKADRPLVIVGSSRALFDIDLDTWEEVAGRRPIQLALEGTDPRPFFHDLAADPNFNGSVLIGVTDVIMLSGYSEMGSFLKAYREETPAQRIGQRISMQIEPRLAFFGAGRSNLALFTLLKQRVPIPNRPGILDPAMDIQGLAIRGSDRNTEMWRAIWEDPERNQGTKDRWMYALTNFPRPPEGTPPLDPQPIFDELRASIEKIRARGGDVAFLRCPSTPPFLDIEEMAFPRAMYWDRLSADTGAGTIHFQDNPSLQGFDLPEWSHIRADQRPAFTRAVIPLWEAALRTRQPVVTLPEVGDAQ